MPRATYCFIKVNVKDALAIRDKGAVISDDPKLFKCIECGKTVRPYSKGPNHRPYFSHLRRNSKCSLSHEKKKT